MTKITNTLLTADTIGIRESLSDLISNIDPTECPFSANAGKRPNPENTFYEWQLDSLATAVTTNAAAEGDDTGSTFTVVSPTKRMGNWMQISVKNLIVGGTQQAVKKAGRKSDLSYNIIKRGVELKRDVEKTCMSRLTAASGTDPRKSATLLGYVTTNSDIGTGAAASPVLVTSGGYTNVRTDGTTRAFTETILKSICQKGFTTGMKVGGAVLMVGALQKQVVSSFAGIATRFKDVGSGSASIVGAADVYVSDFGTITVVPNRFQRNTEAWLLDFDLIGFRELRPYQVIDLAKTGDADKKLMLREWSLQVDNEAGLAGAFDLA